MSRVRQFSDLRQSRSNRKDNFNSTLSSRQLYTPKTPRVQFQTAETAKSQISKQSSAQTHSHYICMNCMNKSMTERKRCHQRQIQNAERSRYNQLQKSRRQLMDKLADSKQKEYVMKRKSLLDENLKMMDRRREQKQKQKQQKQRLRILQEKRIRQLQAEHESANKYREFNKNKFRSQLENQIQQKKQKKLKQQLQSRYIQTPQQDNSYLQAFAKERRDRYKKQLEDQIKFNQLLKEQQLKQSKINPDDFYYTQWEEQNLKKQRHEQEERKKRMREEMNKTQQKQQARKRQRQQKLNQQRMNSIIQRQFEEKQRADLEKMKFDRINRYRSDIRNQIEDNQFRRSKQKQSSRWNIINVQEQPIDTRLCDSCQKQYPKKYLTKI